MESPSYAFDEGIKEMDGDDHVTVAVRVKGVDALPEGPDSLCVFPQDNMANTGLYIDGQRGAVNNFQFDSIHWSLGGGVGPNGSSSSASHGSGGSIVVPESSQLSVFEDLGTPVVSSVLAGYNTCLFAYGQTGSGKTYTMMGKYDSITSEQRGLIPRISEALFAATTTSEEVQKDPESGTTFGVESAAVEKFEVTHAFDVTYVELYLERVHDLLGTQASSSNTTTSAVSTNAGGIASPGTASPVSSPGAALRVREHPKYGPYVDGAVSTRVNSYEEVLALLEIGNANRMVAATDLNATSSRSHAVFTIQYTKIKQEVDTPNPVVLSQQTSKLSLIDLAGSESAGKSGTKGERLKEGGSINKSLLTLGLVIKALATARHRGGSPVLGNGKPVVPYRDSVLTFLLKDSLGGNSRTTMLATIRPGLAFYEESLSTLRYADRAKSIVNQAVVNEDPLTKKIRSMQDQIEFLTLQLASAQEREAAKDTELFVMRQALSLEGGERVDMDRLLEVIKGATKKGGGLCELSVPVNTSACPNIVPTRKFLPDPTLIDAEENDDEEDAEGGSGLGGKEGRVHGVEAAGATCEEAGAAKGQKKEEGEAEEEGGKDVSKEKKDGEAEQKEKEAAGGNEEDEEGQEEEENQEEEEGAIVAEQDGLSENETKRLIIAEQRVRAGEATEFELTASQFDRIEMAGGGGAGVSAPAQEDAEAERTGEEEQAPVTKPGQVFQPPARENNFTAPASPLDTSFSFSIKTNQPMISSADLEKIPGIKDGLNLPVSSFQEGAASFEGFLFKRGQITGFYQRRWFVVRAGRLLWYVRYDDDQSIRGAIDLAEFTFEPSTDAERGLPYGIVLKKKNDPSARVHTLQASSQSEREKWLRSMHFASQMDKDVEDSLREPLRKMLVAGQCFLM